MRPELISDINQREYQEHIVFTMLSDLKQFYDSLSFSAYRFAPFGVPELPNFESYVFSSLAYTLESIDIVLRVGHINDAFALLRKYDDAVLTNIYIDCYLLNNKNTGSVIAEKIDRWIHERERLPNSEKMIKYIRDCRGTISELNNLIYSDGLYGKIRSRCNDNSHFNSLYFMLLNDNSLYLKNRIMELNQFALFLRTLFIFHFVYLFILNEEYMSSSDYTDALDLGRQLDEGSLYLVAPFVQTVFDEYVKKYRKDLADFLINKVKLNLK